MSVCVGKITKHVRKIIVCQQREVLEFNLAKNAKSSFDGQFVAHFVLGGVKSDLLVVSQNP